MNKKADELFLTSNVTLNRSFADTWDVGNAPEQTFSTSVVASRLIAIAVVPVTLLNVGTLLPATLYWMMSPVLIPEFAKLALGDDIVDAPPTAALTVNCVATGAIRCPRLRIGSAVNG